MRTVACPRLSEAEALRDGRLGTVERSRYERHVSGCSACAGEVEALEALAAPLRENDWATNELHVRRERARLLAAFSEAASSAPQPSATSRPAAWARNRWLQTASVAVAVCVLLGLWYARPSSPGSSAVVHAGSAAIWSTHRDGDREEISLSRGELLIHVDHHAAGQPRVRVALPDGELEDIGTVFTVSVQSGRTARVTVQEGSVVLRLRGRAELTIAAGTIWTPEPAPPATASTPPAPEKPTSAAAPGNERERASERPSKQTVRSRAAASKAGLGGAASQPASAEEQSPTAAPSQPSATASDPARDFRFAAATLGRGLHREAASAFADFVARYPKDSRAEDAAYLRVIALQKCGATEEMRSAAREYSRHYPDGLRHAEVARLLDDRKSEGTSTTPAQ